MNINVFSFCAAMVDLHCTRVFAAAKSLLSRICPYTEHGDMEIVTRAWWSGSRFAFQLHLPDSL